MFAEIRALDSEMQTLVYENYNKFISATDTIRKVNNYRVLKEGYGVCYQRENGGRGKPGGKW